ncbi:MAG: sugar transporter permease [Verrucomicrobiaceae bacterium]|nr:sugar transporter permease [Verrucomicrobiaceae bacterium]
MQNFSIYPQEMLTSFWRNRSLINALIKRDILGRYRGSLMGIMWSFLNPLLMLAVYTFVFSVVFKARWGTGNGSRAEFALVLFAGLIVFNLFSECIVRAPSLIVSNTNYVKKVVFPIEILPWVSMGSAMFHSSVSLAIWLLVYVGIFGIPQLTALFLPLIFLPLVFFIMGLSWALASLGVYLRDASQFVGILTTIMMFLSPIFFPATALPEEYRNLLFLNPLTPAIEQTRNALYWGEAPNITMLSTYLIASMLIAWVGFAWFQKTRKGFADVL